MKHLFKFLFILTYTSAFAQVEVTTVTGQFNGSGGVKIGPGGKVYVADFGASLSTGSGTQVWRYNIENDNLELFASGFTGASGNAFDSQGNLFQSNINIGVVKKVMPSGAVSDFASGFVAPVGIAIDDDDNLFVCNCEGASISKVTPGGVVSVFSEGANFKCPNGLTMDSAGNLYASNFYNGNIIKVTPGGASSVFATVPGAASVGYNGHIIYSAAHDILYVASHGSSKIYSLTLNGELTVIAGTGVRGNKDGPADEATFSRPNGIAVSVTGDTLFVNSSIPLTNGNGNPLNPSVLRMITGVNSLFTGTYETANKNIERLNISPVPTSDHFNLEFTLQQSGEVFIGVYDIYGKLVSVVKEGKMVGGQHQLRHEMELENGMYSINIKSGDDELSKPFIVQK